LLLSLMIGVAATAVQAEMMLDFLIDNNSYGTGTLTDSLGVATGTDIVVRSVSGWNTPLGSGTTLTLTDLTYPNPSPVPSFLTVLNFQVHYNALGTAGDFISITKVDPSNTANVLETYLITAAPSKITSAGVVPPSGPDRIFYAAFLDLKPTTPDNAVNTTFGLNDAKYNFEWTGFLHVDFNKGSRVSFSGEVMNTPIPGSLLLLGSGILGLVGIGIRKRA
jgi:hypothetical protein